MLLLIGLVAAEVPVLLEPARARAEAQARAESGGVDALLQAAEIDLLAGAPRDALEPLERLELEIESEDTRARRMRLALDARAVLGDLSRALAVGQALAEQPGWRAHAASKAWEVERRARAGRVASLGAVFFAAALGVLLIGGARALLRPRAPVLGVAAVFGVAVLLALWASPMLGRVAALLFFAWLSLAHAAWSTMVRSDPGPRGRAFIAVLLLVGVLGAGLAVFSGVPWGFALAQL